MTREQYEMLIELIDFEIVVAQKTLAAYPQPFGTYHAAKCRKALDAKLALMQLYYSQPKPQEIATNGQTKKPECEAAQTA